MSKNTIIVLVVLGSLLGLTLLGGGGYLMYYNSIQREGVAMETELNSQYLDNQNELSSYVSKFYESVGVANLKSDKLDQILTDAVKGRYDGQGAARPDRGQLFSVIKEAYPTLDLTIYDKIIDLINSGREAYKNKQTKLLDMLRRYDDWCKRQDIPHKWMVGGFPSQALEARIGTKVTRGLEARDQMYLIVTTKSAQDAYNTGVLDPLPAPGGKK